MEYASNGKANLGVTLGAIGTGIGILSGGLNGILNGGCNNGWNRSVGCCADDMPITRYEATMIQELGAKDSHIALLEADKYTDQKIVEAYKDLQSQIRGVEAQVIANKDAQNAVNMQQVSYNATNAANIQCIEQQISQLQGLTKLVVPNTSVCPGWGNVTITPAAATAAATV